MGTSLLTADAFHDYDSAHRLITTRNADSQNWSSASQKTSWYTYDDLGNRISHKRRTDAAIGYEHDKANRMTKIATKTQGYDKAGNVTLAYSADRGTSYTYRWDHHNRLTGIYDSTNTTRKAAFTYDALGRRVEHINDVVGTTTRYYFDGVNELVEDNQSAARQRYYIHGTSYIDERLMMFRDSDSRPYYYVIDRMYNVRALIDRAGAIVERIAYDGYGRPYIREPCGRGDMDSNTQILSGDATRFAAAKSPGATIWDARADMDDDSDVDSADQTLFDAKRPTWDPYDVEFGSGPTVAQAFSDVGNPYMFQGVPHFALDTAANATEGKLMLNHHRARYADPVAGRWEGRDPLCYQFLVVVPSHPSSRDPTSQQCPGSGADPYLFEQSDPTRLLDWNGLCCIEQSIQFGILSHATYSDCRQRTCPTLPIWPPLQPFCFPYGGGYASKCGRCSSDCDFPQFCSFTTRSDFFTGKSVDYCKCMTGL